MNSVKEMMINIINKQPEDSSYDEILQELSFVNMVKMSHLPLRLIAAI